MIKGRSDSRNRLAWTMIAGLGLVVMGCGEGGTPSAPPKSDDTTDQTAPPAASTSKTLKPSGRGQGLPRG